jgi:hypothetical protein
VGNVVVEGKKEEWSQIAQRYDKRECDMFYEYRDATANNSKMPNSH